ncbi:hypothetical protein LBMAG42_08170 [Deltaproteobacteria bacterium]|nr:hypothetical protein LBMAG42_08170 [Deltaproteobacteria bacterium]
MLLLVTMTARADDVATALTCPTELEPESLRPYAVMDGPELAAAWLAVIEDFYAAETCGCSTWNECTVEACTLPGGATLDLETWEQSDTQWDGAAGCDAVVGIEVQRVRLNAPGGEPGVTVLEGTRFIDFEIDNCELASDTRSHFLRWEGGTDARFSGSGSFVLDERSTLTMELEREGEGCTWAVRDSTAPRDEWDDRGTEVLTDAGAVAVYGLCGPNSVAVIGGAPDAFPVDGTTWARLGPDSDGDLYADEDDPYPDDPLVGPCGPPDHDHDGYASLDDGGPDCNDDNPGINPYATEQLCDGVDQDCDGLDNTDADHDGHDALTCGGDDCDDDDAQAFPGRFDEAGDGVDADCVDGDAETEDLPGCATAPGIALLAFGLAQTVGGRRERVGPGSG